jgi:hypothetical protein
MIGIVMILLYQQRQLSNISVKESVDAGFRFNSACESCPTVLWYTETRVAAHFGYAYRQNEDGMRDYVTMMKEKTQG